MWERIILHSSLLLFGVGALLSGASGLLLLTITPTKPTAEMTQPQLTVVEFAAANYTPLRDALSATDNTFILPKLIGNRPTPPQSPTCAGCGGVRQVEALPEPVESVAVLDRETASTAIEPRLTDGTVSTSETSVLITDGAVSMDVPGAPIEEASPAAEAAPVETTDSYGCPTSSAAQFDVIPAETIRGDHPDRYHADLNLSLRGYSRVDQNLALVSYNGATDWDAPQLGNLFRGQRAPHLQTAYQINQWQWGCARNPHGCVGGPIEAWPVTMVGVSTSPGEAVYIPSRQADIYQGRLHALVLYATERQLTLSYTRRDTVTTGYTVHLGNLCVDPNLLALYRQQNDANGWRQGNHLPAVSIQQPIGTALSNEVTVAIRDHGMFMDPRSAKDWWQR